MVAWQTPGCWYGDRLTRARWGRLASSRPCEGTAAATAARWATIFSSTRSFRSTAVAALLAASAAVATAVGVLHQAHRRTRNAFVWLASVLVPNARRPAHAATQAPPLHTSLLVAARACSAFSCAATPAHRAALAHVPVGLRRPHRAQSRHFGGIFVWGDVWRAVRRKQRAYAKSSRARFTRCCRVPRLQLKMVGTRHTC